MTVTVPGAGNAPSAPANVAAHAVAGGVDITWSAATDDIGVASYRVYRNGVQIGTTAGLSFHDTVTNGVLDYSVAAVDTQNLVGPVGAAPTISVGDAIAADGADRPDGEARRAPRSTLTWLAATDNVGVTGYRVYRNGVLLKTTDGHLGAGHGAARAARATRTRCARPTPPRTSRRRPRRCRSSSPTARRRRPITQLKVVVQPKPWGATLTWKGATDNVAVTGYRIYRDARLIKTVAGLTYTDPGMPHIDMAVYGVAAVDASGNEGTRSRISAVAARRRPDRADGAEAAAGEGPREAPRASQLGGRPGRPGLGAVRGRGRRARGAEDDEAHGHPQGGRQARQAGRDLQVRAVDAAGNRSKLVKVLVRLR